MPKVKSENTRSAATRVKDSVDQLKQSGGSRETFRLQKPAVDAMAKILSTGKDKDKTALINRLLVEESRRGVK